MQYPTSPVVHSKLLLSVPCHLSLLSFESIYLIESHVRFLAIECDLVAIVGYCDVLDEGNQTHSKSLASIACVNCYIFYVSAL